MSIFVAAVLCGIPARCDVATNSAFSKKNPLFGTTSALLREFDISMSRCVYKERVDVCLFMIQINSRYFTVHAVDSDWLCKYTQYKKNSLN